LAAEEDSGAVVGQTVREVVTALVAEGDARVVVAETALVLLIGGETQRRLAEGLGCGTGDRGEVMAEAVDRLVRGLHAREHHWAHALAWLALIPAEDPTRLARGLRPPVVRLAGDARP
jgi:hypothetical protein